MVPEIEAIATDLWPSWKGGGEISNRPDTQLRLFGKPEVSGKRPLGVALARADDIETARDVANAVIADIEIKL